jgi:NTP pyrophosphatase (non-canonical NTP hydrolase)
MTQDEERQILKEAVDTFGIENQLAMLQEECAELIVAISHYKRGRSGSKTYLSEEIADVHIMMNQIILATPLAVEFFKEQKLQRLKERIMKYKNLSSTE